MSNYFRFVCDDLRQQIDPGRIPPGLGDDPVALLNPNHPVGRLLTHAMISGQFWRGRFVRAIHDNDESDEDAFGNYEDITHKVLRDWSAHFAVFNNLAKKDPQ
jgi:hypothetical protein